MPDAQGFTKLDDRLFCIEHLSPEARERLKLVYLKNLKEWTICWRAEFDYADDAAILAEVEGELIDAGLYPVKNRDAANPYVWMKYAHSCNRVIGQGDRFTAAHADGRDSPVRTQFCNTHRPSACVNRRLSLATERGRAGL